MNDMRAMLISNSDREAKIRDVLLKVRPPMASEQVLQAWREGVAQGVTETMLSEADRIGKARAGDQQRLMHLEYAVDRYADGIREHRDTRGDDRCWRDDEALYKLLPEGFQAPALDSAVELERCKAFIASRQNPATEYVSPERRIEALIAVVRGYGCHSVDCVPGLSCSCGAAAALHAAGLSEAEVWK